MTGCCFGKHCDSWYGIYLNGQFRHPVQLYESLMLAVLGIISVVLIAKNKSALLISYIYVLGYSTLRFILEFYRGDVVRGIYWGGLSSSQMISLLIIVLASLTIIFVKRRKKNNVE